MTDNGPAYRSHQNRDLCRHLQIKHLRTEPYRPRTNGRIERFIRTLTEGWAHAVTYRNSHDAASPCPPG
jgi:transposase InsO family protein